MEYAELLEKLNEQYLKADAGTEKNDDLKPNIFEILQIENKEVLYCRFLGHLLEPNSKLNNGSTKALSTFMEKVLELENIIPDKPDIVLEEIIDENRRVDIVIRTNGNVYPIEVKINAEDQESQLFDYWNYYFAENTCNNSQVSKKIFYLTPTGKKPSEYSIVANREKSATYDIQQLKEDIHYKRLSFNEINEWLCNTDFNYEGISEYLLEQYKEVVKNMVIKQKQTENLDRIIKDENGYIKEDYKKLLIDLFDNSEEIKIQIQQQYLKNSLKYNDNNVYELCDADEEDKKKDKYCLLTIKKDRNTVLWICANTNLYIVAEELKADVFEKQKYPKKFKWQNAGKNYIWKYISPDNKNLFAMGRNLNLCIDDKEVIEILDILKEIKQ